jgi:hypothetical protein
MKGNREEWAMDSKQKTQLGILAACLVVGLGILFWMLSNRVSSSGRIIVVDATAKDRAATMPATTRVAATRPLKGQLLAAYNKNKRAVVMELLKSDPLLSTVEYEEAGYATPLHFSAIDGDLEMAALLLANGANINAVEDRHHGTPLEWAAYNAQVEMTAWLLSRGAVVDDPSVEVAQMGVKGTLYSTRQPKAKYVKVIAMLMDAKKGKRPATFPATRSAYPASMPATTQSAGG